jgi:hypothetical protein
MFVWGDIFTWFVFQIINPLQKVLNLFFLLENDNVWDYTIFFKGNLNFICVWRNFFEGQDINNLQQSQQ